MDDKKIKRPECPQDGPADGVMLTADCIRTDFINNLKGTEQVFQQMEKSHAHIAASVEIGIFSIRDMVTNTMLTVSIDDAMEVMKKTIELSKGAKG